MWPPQQRDNDEPNLVNVAPVAQTGWGGQQPIYQQPAQQNWGMPAPMPVPEETKDYGYNKPGDGPGPFLGDDKYNWSKAPSRRSFKSDGGNESAPKYQVSNVLSLRSRFAELQHSSTPVKSCSR